MRCPCCENSELAVFFERPPAPVLCNVLWPEREQALAAPMGEIQLGFCSICGMIFNVAFDPDRMVYDQAYENSLHFSPRFQAYAEQLAGKLVAKHGLHGKRVIDVGCGKGDFLKLLCELGDNQGLGFDASYEGQEHSADGRIRFVRDYYSPAHARHTADLISCRHVLEHIPTPREFLAQVHGAAAQSPEVCIFFEVPNALYTLRDLGIWDIIYEHCSYFTAPSLERLFGGCGFRPTGSYSAFGEQFLCLEAALGQLEPGAAGNTGESAASIDELAQLVARFADHYREKVADWNERLGGLLAQGRTVAIWGSGSKGVTFLNTLEAGRQIALAVDINVRKQGRFVPGGGQQVVAPQALAEAGVDVVLIMNPLYEPEIRGMLDQVGCQADLLLV